MSVYCGPERVRVDGNALNNLHTRCSSMCTKVAYCTKVAIQEVAIQEVLGRAAAQVQGWEGREFTRHRRSLVGMQISFDFWTL